MALRAEHHDDTAAVEARTQLRLAAFAAISWMVYDTLIFLGDEIEYLWFRRLSWITGIYTFTRYLPIVHGLAVLTLKSLIQTAAGCKGWIIYELVFIQVLTLAVEVVLVIRIYILYNHSRWILIIIIIAFVAEIAGMVIILGVAIPGQRFSSGCLVTSAPNLFMAYWITGLAFETFLFSLTIFKFCRMGKRDLGQPSVLYLFFRDGTWAFALIFVIMVLNALMYKLEDNALAGMGYLWALAVLSFTGSHVILNLRALSIPFGTTSESTCLTTFGIPSFFPQETTGSDTIHDFSASVS